MRHCLDFPSPRLCAKLILDRLRLISWVFQPPIRPTPHRYTYQRPFIQHQFSPCDKVLDIGSGGDPFPYATILADRFLEPSAHRSAKFDSHGLPVVVCDITAMPFADAEFDYVVCSHVLEHVDDPIQACRELQRVGRAGFIETPSLLKDALFAWAKDMHKWHVVGIGQKLVFFEYSQRQLQGLGDSAWRDVIFGSVYHPLQRAFNTNQDLFNVMFEWHGSFEAIALRLDGTIEAL